MYIKEIKTEIKQILLQERKTTKLSTMGKENPVYQIAVLMEMILIVQMGKPTKINVLCLMMCVPRVLLQELKELVVRAVVSCMQKYKDP